MSDFNDDDDFFEENSFIGGEDEGAQFLAETALQQKNYVKVLSDMEERFCQEMVKDYDLAQAVVRALIDQESFPGKSALEIAQTLLQNSQLYERIAEIAEQQVDEGKLDKDEVVRILVRQARTSLADVLDENNSPSIEAARQRGVLASIRKYTRITLENKSGSKKTIESIELVDPIRAIGLLVNIGGLKGRIVAGDDSKLQKAARQIRASVLAKTGVKLSKVEAMRRAKNAFVAEIANGETGSKAVEINEDE